MRLLTAILILILCSCADDKTEIIYHTVSLDELAEMCGEDYYCCDGYSTWDGNGTCDIYLLEEWVYNALYCADAYDAVKAHEVRHCFRGDWHDQDYRIDVCGERKDG